MNIKEKLIDKLRDRKEELQLYKEIYSDYKWHDCPSYVYAELQVIANEIQKLEDCLQRIIEIESEIEEVL